MLNLGEMRHEVIIERRTSEQDTAGEQLDQWILVARRRAQLVATAGRELQAAQQQVGRVPVLFKLRYLFGVLPSMRLTCSGVLYDIKSAVDPDGRRAELLVTCEERVGESP